MSSALTIELDDMMRTQLEARAAEHGQSMEAEVQRILRGELRVAPTEEELRSLPLGDAFARLFSGIGFEEGEFARDDDEPIRPAALDG